MIDVDRSIFVAGTDTGVGKTRVAVQLLRQAAAAGRRMAAMKPVAAGAQRGPDGWRNDDALALAAAANVALPYELLNPCCLPLASSPHLAAAAAGVAINIPSLVEAYRQIAAQSEAVVVEGAGGWLVPLDDTRTMADLAVALQLPVLLVVGVRLGCINHALLTAAAIRASGLTLAGWVANRIEPSFAGDQQYVQALRERLPEPCWGELPWAPGT
jgi:dethiobiotin synthetase